MCVVCVCVCMVCVWCVHGVCVHIRITMCGADMHQGTMIAQYVFMCDGTYLHLHSFHSNQDSSLENNITIFNQYLVVCMWQTLNGIYTDGMTVLMVQAMQTVTIQME